VEHSTSAPFVTSWLRLPTALAGRIPGAVPPTLLRNEEPVEAAEISWRDHS
jgi:hypothetical protein